MSDSESSSSSHSSINNLPLDDGHEDVHDDVHSSISGASHLNDHRHQNMSLPIREGSALKSDVNSMDLRSKMCVDDDDDNDDYAVEFNDRFKTGLSFTNTSIPAPINTTRRLSVKMTRSRSRSRSSFSEQVKHLIRPRGDSQSGPVGTGFLLPTSAVNSPMIKTVSRSSNDRRHGINIVSNANDDSDLNSHASRESEEDVCFPMLPDHVTIKGIDFSELDEFIEEQREENELISRREEELKYSSNLTTSSEKCSSAALKYTPKTSTEYPIIEKLDSSDDSEPGVTFDSNGNKYEDSVPTRFSFFSSDREETLHTPDLTTLVKPDESIKALFEPEDSIWWLDCTCPTDNEMKVIAKAFGIHPLTAEDIRMQETREKVELFKSYYFVCFHTFETDQESEDFLEPINVYIVVFKTGILTFHFSPIVNPANVRRRVRQLRDYVNVSADWLCYAMIDDITDGFAPIIHSIEYEADAIEDSVFMNKDNDFGQMLLRIGESRRKVMTLMRLLQGKADVIKMFSKRCQEEVNPGAGATSAQPRADIALYLGDIQDHIITMFQSLLSFEKIFSRSHTNYLAQLQVESFYINNRVTDILSKVTMLGTILVPMNLVTGLFGMNVKVPGGGQANYGWFGGIIGFIFLLIGTSIYLVNVYVNRMNQMSENILPPLSVKDFKIGRKSRAKFNNTGTGGGRQDMRSLPTKFTKYGEW